MAQGNNDIEELEELLTELEGQEAQLVAPYSEDEDAVTQLMEAPLGDQEWMVQVTALDRRMMSTDQVVAELRSGSINGKTLVWKGGMDDWSPIERVSGIPHAEPTPAPAPPAAAWSQPQTPIPSRPMAAPPPAPPTAPAMAAPSAPVMAAPPPPKPASAPVAAAPVASAPTAAPARSVPASPAPPVPSPATYSTRPVAVDFTGSAAARDRGPMQTKRAVMFLGAAAVLAVGVIASSMPGGDDSTSAAASMASVADPGSVTSAPEEAENSEGEAEEAATADAPSTEETKDEEAKEAAKEADADETEGKAEATAEASETEDEASEEEEDTAEAAVKTPRRSRYNRKRASRSRSRSRAARRAKAEPKQEDSAGEDSEPETLAQAMKNRVASSGGAVAEEKEEEEATEEKEAEEPAAEAPPKSSGSSGGKSFDRDAAMAALQVAANGASNCRPAGGPSGSGRVQVRYEPSGRVASVSMLTSKFDGTTTGSCVRMLFRRARVPSFTGAPVVVNKSFEIP